MKRILIALPLLLLALTACQKDTMQDVDDGKWNHEKNISEILFENQIGLSTITRTASEATVEFLYNLDATGSMSIPIVSLVPSYGATASVEVGDKLDFDNADNAAKITITSVDGSSLDWTIKMNAFTEPLSGSWTISLMEVFGGVDYGRWGGGQFKDFGEINSTVFSGDELPVNELDNTYTFTHTGFTASGNSYGTITNDAGADGKYGGYVLTADNKVSDCNAIYRMIPKSGGTWEHDVTQDVYYIRDGNGTLVNTCNFHLNGYSYAYQSGSDEYIYRDFPANTLIFDVTPLGLMVGDWGAQYSTTDIYAWNPHTVFYTLSK